MADPDEEKASQQVGPDKPPPSDPSPESDGQDAKDDDANSRASNDNDKF